MERGSKELKKWYKIRDLLTGTNYETRYIELAFELAKKCTHPDAVWLVSRLNEAPQSAFVNLPLFLHDLVVQKEDNDVRTLCFSDHYEFVYVAAAAGYAYAQSVLGQYHLALKQRERDALLHFAYKAKDKTDAKLLFQHAALLGSVVAMFRFSEMETDIRQKWYWAIKAAKQRHYGRFVHLMRTEQIWDAWILYRIGHLCHDVPYIISFFGPGTASFIEFRVRLYKEKNDAFKLAVHTWFLIGLRLKVCKDMRIYIGKMIWNGRKDTEY